MKSVVILMFALILMNLVGATCSSGQIDINSASATELDGLYGIGAAKAQAIIDARPYASVNELTNAKGIGPSTLQEIKDQGLACVADKTSTVNPDNSTNQTVEVAKKTPATTPVQNPPAYDNNPSPATVKVIEEDTAPIYLSPNSTNPQDIKTTNSANSSGIDYSVYSIAAFCVLLGALYLLKPRKKKNEFKG